MRYGLLVSLCVMLLGGCQKVRAAGPPPTFAPDCSNAVAFVQAYRAPGQSEPLGQRVADRLRQEAQMRPVGPGVWKTYTLYGGCAAEYQFTLGNEPRALRWEVLDGGATVRTVDALSTRLSGW